MSSEASIVLKAYDQISGVFEDIEDGSQELSKELEVQQRKLRQLGERWSEFVSQSSKSTAAALETKKAMDEARTAFKRSGDAAEKVKFEGLTRQYKTLTAEAKAYDEAARQTRKAMRTTAEEAKKASLQTPAAGGGFGSMLAAMGKAGGYQMLGQLGGQWAGVLGGSYFGSNGSALLGGALSGAGSGAALGTMIAPGVGTAVGAAIGAGVGLLGGAAQNSQKKDDAFKAYVQQATEGQLSALQQSQTQGSAMAAGREKDLNSLTTMLGSEEKAVDYLSKLVDLANDTPLLYQDLMSMSLAMGPYAGKDGERMLREMVKIGDAGAALGHTTADSQQIGITLGRMRVSDKAQLEDLNMITDRGIDAIGMISQAKGIPQKQTYDLISKGKISGKWAADVILKGMTEAFEGSMEKQSKTFAGLESTVQGLTQELDNAMGEAYNEVRKQGLADQRDWLSGSSGELVKEANAALGAWKADLENQKEQLTRDAVDAAMDTSEYKQAKAEGDAAKMGEIIMAARVSAQNQYMATKGAQKMAEMERQLLQSVREDSAANKEGWLTGWRRNTEYTKGWMASWNAHSVPAGPKMETGHVPGTAMHGSGYASGLRTVPYDGFSAPLHRGERVLSRQEADRMDRKGGGAPIVHINVGSMAVRQDSDIDAIAGKLAKLIRGAVAADGGM